MRKRIKVKSFLIYPDMSNYRIFSQWSLKRKSWKRTKLAQSSEILKVCAIVAAYYKKVFALDIPSLDIQWSLESEQPCINSILSSHVRSCGFLVLSHGKGTNQSIFRS